jgi:glycosyltransferase involved in cell wall biosynthesis
MRPRHAVGYWDGYHPAYDRSWSTTAPPTAPAYIARDDGAQVVCAPQRGYGAASHAGLLAAVASVVAVMDADASLNPQQLDRVVAPGLPWRLACRTRHERRAAVTAFAMSNHAATVIVLAKESVPGRVKTRLQRAFSASQVAALRIVVLVGLRRWGKGRHQRWKLHSSWNCSAQFRRRSRAAGSAGVNFPANSPGTALASSHAVGLA